MDTVGKTDIARLVAEKTSLTQAEARKAIDALLDVVKSHAEAGTTVRFTGFGTFSVKARPARQGRNPRTGETVDIPESRKLGFKPARTATA